MLLLVDLDGVVYRASEAVPGVPAVLAARAALGDDVVYVTNNAMAYRADYVPRLAGHGAPVTLERVVTSASASAVWIRESLPAVRRVLVVGAGGLERELREAGFDVVTSAWAAERMHKEGLRIAVAADCVRAGAAFVATNRDPVYPTERGLRPGAGSVVAAIETASRTSPVAVVGKPQPLLLQVAARSVGADPATAVMIGDALTDVAAGRAVGARTILMLTGVTSRAMADALPAGERPTRIAADADELAAALRDLGPA